VSFFRALQSPVFVEFLDRRHIKNWKWADRGAGPAGVVGHLVKKSGQAARPKT
jgi:hypothetical protein